MINSWLVLLPPVLVLAIALISRNIIVSLFFGILLAGAIATNFAIADAFSLVGSYSYDTITDPDNLYTYGFFFLMGILIALLSYTNAAQAFGATITKWLRSTRSAEASSLGLSTMLFVDDYLNSLTVGYVMHPLTDKFKVPRVKLAFLIDSMTAPLAIIVPLSSWMAWIVRQLEVSGISTQASENPLILADPFYVYLKSIPYVFYSFMVIAAAWYIVYKRVSFGPMARHEEIAEATGNLFGGRKPLEHALSTTEEGSHSLMDFLLPMGTLAVTTIVGVLYTGGYTLFGGTHTVIESLQHTNIFVVLCWASGITVLGTIALFLFHKRLNAVNIPTIVYNGIMLMLLATITVYLAAIFAALLREELFTGRYLAELLVGHFSIDFLPFMFYVTSVVIAITTGSSWGTLAIIPPIAIPLIINLLNISTPTTLEPLCILFPCLGAIFSGCVAGDHISPISDSTVMAATSSGSYLDDHITTQLPYGTIIVIWTGIAYLIIGLVGCNNPWLSIGLSLGISTLFSFATLSWFTRRHKAKKA